MNGFSRRKTETVWVDTVKESTLQYSLNATILFHVLAYILVVLYNTHTSLI